MKKKYQHANERGRIFLPSKNRIFWLIIVSTFVLIVEKEPVFGYSYEDICPTCSTDDIYNKERSGIFSQMPVRIWTDKTLYSQGSQVTIHGTVANPKPDFPITITVFSPQTNMIHAAQIQISDDRTFETTINTSDDLWNENGLYTIRAQYGAQAVNDRTAIEIITSSENATLCFEDQFELKSNTVSYCIPYDADGITIKSALVSSESYSMVLMLDAKREEAITITIPRNILDSKSSTSDSPFVVLIDGQPTIDAFELYSDENSRTLEIPISEHAKELEIIGTYAIPEFGAAIIMTLIVSITTLIIISQKNNRLSLWK